MESGIRLLEKSVSDGGSSKSNFSGVIFRDYNSITDRCALVIMLYDFMKVVHDRDGLKLLENKYSAIDCEIAKYEDEKCLVWLAQDGDRLVGFVIFNLIYDCIVAVRAAYFSPEYRHNGLLNRFYERGLEKGFKKFYYQTYKTRKPFVANDILISENDELITWEIK